MKDELHTRHSAHLTTRTLISIAAIFVLLAIAANSWVRLQQLYIWQANPSITQLGSAPLFSTADAPYYLTQAKLIQSGQNFQNKNAVVIFLILKTCLSNRQPTLPFSRVRCYLSSLHLLRRAATSATYCGQESDDHFHCRADSINDRYLFWCSGLLGSGRGSKHWQEVVLSLPRKIINRAY